MPEYLHPGVYIEEVSYRTKPIEGVSTSTAGMVGRTRKGPVGRPMLVTSFAQFTRAFGRPISNPSGPGDHLGHAVRAFFDNGGKRTYIVRVLGKNAVSSSVALAQGTVLTLPAGTTVRGGAQTIPVVSLRNLWLRTSPTVTIEVLTRADAGATAWTSQGTFVVDGYVEAQNQLRLQSPLPANTRWSAATTHIRIAGVTVGGAGPTITARNPGVDGDQLAVELRPSDLPPVRLATPRLQRARPVIHTFATGAAPASSAVTLPLTAIRQIRPGDTLRFAGIDGATTVRVRTVAAANVTLTESPGSAPLSAPFSAGTVLLMERGGIAAIAPGVALGNLSATERVLPDGTMPHAIAAWLRTGDRIQISGSPTLYAVGVVTLNTATDNVQVTPPVIISGAEVTLVETSPTSPRLLVGTTAGLVTPFPATPGTAEPIAITDDVASGAARALLVDPQQGAILIDAVPAPVTLSSWTAIESLRMPATNQVAVASTASFYAGAIVAVDDGTAKQHAVVASVDAVARVVTFTAPLTTPVVLGAAPADRKAYLRTLELDVLVYEGGVLKETFKGLTWNPDSTADSFRRYYVARINDPATGSQLVTVTPPASPPSPHPDDQPTTAFGHPTSLINGNDGAPITAVDLVGTDNGPGQRTGIEALRERDDISLVAVPGAVDEVVQQAVITHCELLRYRFGVLDGVQGESDVSRIQQHRNNYDSNYAGYYLPWLRSTDLETGASLLVPPSGHVLGICARVDNERGVHKAPANEVVRGITDVELPFGDGEQDVLNPTGVNLVREFTGRGIRVWGGRTVSSDAEWKYVNIRRLFIFLEHSIDRGTQWVVFEPNTQALWQRVVAAIESFLFGVWSSGALMGATPEEAYFVRCDETTMTQDDVDNGRLVCTIGIAPAFPAEFVIFRIGQWTASSKS